MLWQKASDAGMTDEEIGKLFDDAIDGSAAELADALRKDAPRMLAEHNTIRTGFEQRLQARWRSALDLYEVVLVSCTEAASDLHDDLTQDAAPPSEHPIKLHALTLLHARACMVASEVFALLRTGHAAGAQARWRTLHEIAVIAFAIGSGTEDVANRYLLHSCIERWKEAECYQDNCGALGQEPYFDSDMAVFRADYDAVVRQYGKGYKEDWGWSKPLFPSPTHRPNFDDLEKLAGLGHNKPTVKQSHRTIHSGASGTLDVLELYGRGKVMLAGASNAGLAGPGYGSLIAIYQVTTALLVNGPNEVTADNLMILKGIALLVDQAGDAFDACQDEIEREELEREELERASGADSLAAAHLPVEQAPAPDPPSARSGAR